MTTSIEWTDETWNPVVGCSIVSAGCEHCYAMGVAHRGMSPEHRGLTVLRAHGKGPRWNGEVRFLPERLAQPLAWKRPRRVFVNSMSDLFHEGLTFEQIAAVFGAMAATPHHTYQILTKRPERARVFFAKLAASIARHESIEGAAWLRHPRRPTHPLEIHLVMEWLARHTVGLSFQENVTPVWPLPNVWLGVSVEDQKTADERIPVLLDLPAAIRWVSYEPALGPIDFRPARWMTQRRRGEIIGDGLECLVNRDALDWIVVGGESGPRARPFAIEWAQRTVEACAAAGVPCFVKQLGAVTVTEERPGIEPGSFGWAFNPWRDRKGGDPSEWPGAGIDGLDVRQWPEVRS